MLSKKRTINISKRDVVWSYASVIMTLGVNIFLLPLIMNKLSDDELGLWYTFLAVGNIALLFDFGFKPTIARNITYVWCGATDLKKEGVVTEERKQNTDYELLKSVMQACKRIYLFVGILATFFLLTIGSVYIWYVTRNILSENYIIAWIIYVIAILLNIYFSYYNAFLSGVGAIAEMNISNVVARIVQLLVSFVMLILGYGIISVSIAYLLYGVFFRFVSKRLFWKYEGLGINLKKYYVKTTKTEIFNLFQTIWHNAWRDGLVSFANYLTSQIGTLLCSLFLSLSDTATYGLTLQLVGAIASIATTFYSAYQPKLQANSLEFDKTETKKLLSLALVTYYVIYILGIAALVVVGVPLLKIIKSDTEIRMDVLIVYSIYMFLYKNHILFASYIAGTNRVPYVKAFLVSGVIMTFFLIVLLETTSMGMWALIVSPLLTELCYDNWKWPKFVLDEMELSLKEFVVNGIKNIYSCALSIKSR